MQATIRKEEEVVEGVVEDAMRKLELDNPGGGGGSGTATDSTASLPVSVSKPTGACVRGRG